LLGKYKGGGLAYSPKHGLKICYAARGLLDIALKKIMVKRLSVGVSLAPDHSMMRGGE
jgi:hypothetical protein